MDQLESFDSDRKLLHVILLDLMKMGVEEPRRLIDINALPLGSVEILPDGGAQIGALAGNSNLAYHPALRRLYPVLWEALLSGAPPQLRNMATVGGNLMQRTRRPYFLSKCSETDKIIPDLPMTPDKLL